MKDETVLSLTLCISLFVIGDHCCFRRLVISCRIDVFEQSFAVLDLTTYRLSPYALTADVTLCPVCFLISACPRY
jgi:hypothetical protein